MVKKKKGNEQSLYLLAIVSIVAIVGVVVLVLNAGGETGFDDDNIAGEALALKVPQADGASLVKTIKLGYGKDSVVVQASDCGARCDICGCDAEGNNCECQDYQD